MDSSPSPSRAPFRFTLVHNNIRFLIHKPIDIIKPFIFLFSSTQDFLDEMQADGLGAPSALRGPPSTSRGGQSEGGRGAAPPHSCPPPFLQVPRDACRVTTCRSDKECHTEGHKCCNNGCTFTCMAALPPPPRESHFLLLFSWAYYL